MRTENLSRSLRDRRNFPSQRLRQRQHSTIRDGRKKSAIDVPSAQGPNPTERGASVPFEFRDGGGAEHAPLRECAAGSQEAPILPNVNTQSR